MLHFSGEMSFWGGFFLAAAGFVLAFFLYKNSLKHISHRQAMWLPWLRSTAVLMLALMLTGPTLRVRKVDRKQTRLLFFIDLSKSMDVTDQEMDVARKMALVRALGWLPYSKAAETAEKTAVHLEKTMQSARRLITSSPLTEEALYRGLELLQKEGVLLLSDPTLDLLTKSELEDVENSFGAPLKRMLVRFRRAGPSAVSAPKECLDILDTASRWHVVLNQKARRLAALDSGGERRISAALAEFDKTSRSHRVGALVLDGADKSLISRLAPHFEIELLGLKNDRARTLWSSTDGLKNIPPGLPNAEANMTDIASAVLERVENGTAASAPEDQAKTVVVLLSDGRHNAGGSPARAAQLLGDRGIPVFTVGVGSEVHPPDLAIAAIEAPKAVFFEDRVSGFVHIKDDMSPGQPFTLEIKNEGKVLWKKEMMTSQRSVFKVPFDFPIKGITSERATDLPSKQTLVTLGFEAVLSPLPQEREIRNNTARFTLRATTGKKKLLLLDGRPRWEARYLRNLFERDPRWQVNALLGEGSGKTWLRGTTLGTFPADEQTLLDYDTVIFGDVTPDMLADDEQQWISNFVAKKGGGILFLDGARKTVSQYTQGPLSKLLPVRFDPNPSVSSVNALRLSERGRAFAALKLEEDKEDPQDVWKSLPPPLHTTACSALPGAETLLEADTSAGIYPALVVRQFGSGHVAYMGFDETWRWRNEVAGKYQERFWSQLVDELGEATFSAVDDQIALDTDSVNYSPGSSAVLRARVREGNIRTSLEGTLWREGVKVATVSLRPDSGRPDLFIGRTGALEEGVYDFGIQAMEESAGTAMRIRFEVAPPHKGELSELTLNEPLLAQMSSASHGQYLREEQVKELPDLLSPHTTGKAVESEIPVGQSYGWFLTIVSLLTAEWILRKRIGLI